MVWSDCARFPCGVRGKLGHIPDWRDEAAYAPLFPVARTGFAWEWLRRDPVYRATATAALARMTEKRCLGAETDARAADWGLHAFEAADLDARHARPLWRKQVFPFVLEAEAADEGGLEDRIDLGSVGHLAALAADADGNEHLLLSDGCRSIRLDIVSGSVRSGPVMLRYRLAGLARAATSLVVLRQLLALCRDGDFSVGLHPREQRAGRWILMLRAHDALAAGAGQREIAAHLLAREAMSQRWRVEAPSLRSRAQRLVREARRMAAGGYLSLLERQCSNAATTLHRACL